MSDISKKPPINTKAILDALKGDLKAADVLKKEWDAEIREWRNAYHGKPYGNEVKGKSTIVSRDIKKQSEWQHASIIDPFVSTDKIITCTPVTAEDVKAARQNELILNTQFVRKFSRYNFMTKAVKILDMDGTVVIQTGWDYKDKEVEVEKDVVVTDDYGNETIVKQLVKETVVIQNQPTAKVCRNEDIYIDPTCMDDLDNAQFVIHRYETDLSTLRQDGRYKNLDKVARNLAAQDTDYVPEDNTQFSFKDDPRKKIIVYEYWGNYDINGDGIAEAIVCAWVNDTVIRLQSNPYPDGKPPFIVVPFNSVPFKIHGESNAELIGDNQKVKTAIVRGIIDNMAQSNNGQVGIRKGALDIANRKKWLAGKNFEFNGSPQDFWQGSYNQIPSSAFDMLGLMNNEIEAITGVKSFSGGINGTALGNMLDIDTDVPMIDGSFKKLKDIVDGDVIIGSNGKGTTVVKAHEIKYPKIAYTMKFSNDSTVVSGGEHLWTIKIQGTKRKWREWHTVDANTVYEHIKAGRTVYIPRIKQIHNGTPVTSTISPYVLGYWLGDGNSHSARITTADEEVLDLFYNEGYECVEVKDSSKCGNATMYDVYKKGTSITFDENGNFTSNNSLHSELRGLNLLARYGGYKHIPKEFMNAPYETKMELIRGLMDSDGYAHSGSFVQFSQSEGHLKDDFIKLIKSMGLTPKIRVKTVETANSIKVKAHNNNPNTQLILSTKPSYEIGFCPWDMPFKLTRKAVKWQEPKYKNTVTLTSMEVTDKVLMRCLTVDSDDKLYAVTDSFTLTHNTATAVRGALDATSVRRMNIVRNIAENLIKPLMRKWIAYNAEFLDEEEVVRITNEEFVPIRKDDLTGKIDIIIDVSTAEDNAAKSQELSFLLQTVGPSEDPAVRREIMAQIMELMKMPEQAKRIREYKPQPDPLEEQMKQLQLENAKLANAKLKAEVANLYSRAGENDLDKELKAAKAEVEKAKARKLESEADIKDLDFLAKDSGTEFKQKLALEEYRRRANLDSMAFQAMQGDTNLGVL